MILDTSLARLTLAAGQLARLQLKTGTRLTGVSGTTWITLDGDSRDIVLDRGETWTLDVDARVVACALRADGTAELQVDEPLRTFEPVRGLVAA